MCDMGIASLAMGVLSTGIGMYSQRQQQRQAAAAAQASANYNAQIAQNTADTQEQLARNEIAKGVADRERQQRQAARAMGEMRAGMGASGFEMDSGSALSLLAESAGEHQYDSQIISQNAEQAAWQHLMGQTSAMNEKSFADYQFANAGSGSSGLSMAGSLLGGVGSAIGGYASYSKLNQQPGRQKQYDRALGEYVASTPRH